MALKLLKSFFTSGAISYSSRFLIQKIISKIDFNKAKVIVELGAGNGCITREILKKMSPDAKLICFEINKNYKSELDLIHDSRLEIHYVSAEKMTEVVGSQQLDYVISSVPFKILPQSIVEKILLELKNNLNKNYIFIHYSYFITQYLPFAKIFKSINLSFELRNIPPAFVYICHSQKKEL